nr:LRR receptor-like serine/threonine-protein kinase GSO1 [Ipomoea batatas]
MDLLNIKAFFMSINNDTSGDTLPTWVEKGDDDCCRWERVTCNPATAHVTGLHLHTLTHQSWNTLNVSLFTSFEGLVNLDLSGNHFGYVYNEGFDNLIQLKSLEALNLADNNFDDYTVRSIASLTTLRSLNLSSVFNNVSLQELSTLTNLEMLDLQGNYFDGLLSAQGMLI